MGKRAQQPRTGDGRGARRGRLPRSGAGLRWRGAASATGSGRGAKRDSLPRSEGGVWGARRSTLQQVTGAERSGIHSRIGKGGVWGVRRSTLQQVTGAERSGIHSRVAKGGLGGAPQRPPEYYCPLAAAAERSA